MDRSRRSESLIRYLTQSSRFFQAGNRMYIQDIDQEEIRDLIQQCWALSPMERPSFADILTYFNDLLFDNINGASAELQRIIHHTSSVLIPSTIASIVPVSESSETANSRTPETTN